MPEPASNNNIKQSTRLQAGSSLFHRQTILILITTAVLSLITIIGITTISIYITKAEITINETTNTTNASTTINESKFNKWQQNAITVAGGKGEGQQLNQLHMPVGIFIDEKKNIFIAELNNHRIVEWKHNAKEGQIIAGGNGQRNQ
ncbi:unnamed protein product [Adineta steineri]|uniref:NHL repeat containing protein n=1 Tax=Adineta steineri TaxID=433720 RepID=A0A819SJ84_9BILA|nr:unnamed protein product [Adineta steineri]CAF4060516.1 unnamed protein product [Adineta steineri]